jgi:hypothetical protein
VIRLASLAAIVIVLLVAYEHLLPGFVSTWQARLEALSGPERNPFDPENKARGLDNMATVDAISASPLFGLGTTIYPREYSLRTVPATDIHPTLQMGLVGGVPAMVLSLIAPVLIIRFLLFRIRRNTALARPLLPIVAVLAMNAFVVNVIGAGGTLMGPGVLATCIFLTEAIRILDSAPRPSLGYSRQRYEDFDPDPVIQSSQVYSGKYPVCLEPGLR